MFGDSSYKQGYIEKFNRTIQEEFIDQNEMWLDNLDDSNFSFWVSGFPQIVSVLVGKILKNIFFCEERCLSSLTYWTAK